MTTRALRPALEPETQAIIKEFIEHVRACMERRKMTGPMLDRILGTKNYANQLLKGHTNLTFRTAVIIAHVLEMKFAPRLVRKDS